MKKKTLFLPLLGLVLWSCQKPAKPVITGREGESLPAFRLLLGDSTAYHSPAPLPNGLPMVVFYFSPQCPYCRAEVRTIVDHIAQLKRLQFCLVTAWPLAYVRSFSQQFGLSAFPNITVGQDSARFLSRYYSIQGVPFLALYDRTGRMKSAYLGDIGRAEFSNLLK